jgi:hypothetical protein
VEVRAIQTQWAADRSSNIRNYKIPPLISISIFSSNYFREWNSVALPR